MLSFEISIKYLYVELHATKDKSIYKFAKLKDIPKIAKKEN